MGIGKAIFVYTFFQNKKEESSGTNWKKKGKDELDRFCQNTESGRGESYFKRFYRNGSSLKFRKIK
jgi:hypothetical protein